MKTIVILMFYLASSAIIPDMTDSLHFSTNLMDLTNQSIFLNLSFTNPSLVKENQFFRISLQTEVFARYKCRLLDTSTNQYILVKASPVKQYDNSAFCEIKDTTYSFKRAVNYTLSVFFSETRLPMPVGDYVSLSLQTSNGSNAFTVMNKPVFGSVYLFKTQNVNPFYRIEATTVLNAKSNGNLPSLIFPNNTFTYTVVFKALRNILKNTVLVLEYDSLYFNAPTSVKSVNFDTTELGKKLSGSLTVAQVSEGKIRISGIEEDIQTGRIVELSFSEFKTKGRTVDSASLSLNLFYTNSYSLLFSAALPALKVSSVEITASLQTTTSPAAYSSMSWQLSMTYSLNQDLSEGFLSLTHTNNTATSRIVPLASTCQFESGKRPCHPLNKRVSVTEDTQTGMFFKLENIIAKTTYSLTFWVYFENCGSSFITSDSSSITKPELTVSIYDSIVATGLDSARFKQNTATVFNPMQFELDETPPAEEGVNLLASKKLTSQFTCYNAALGLDLGLARNSYLLSYNETFSKIIRHALELNAVKVFDLGFRLSSDYVFNYVDQNGKKLSIDSGEQRYLYNQKKKPEFLALTAEFKRKIDSAHQTLFPSDVILANAAILSRLELTVQNKWFTKGNYKGADPTENDFCMVTWNLVDSTAAPSVDLGISLTVGAGTKLAAFEAFNQTGTTLDAAPKMIYEHKTKPSIDTSKTTFSDPNFHKIVSTNNYTRSGSVYTYYYRFPLNTVTSVQLGTNPTSFVLLTTCLKWTTPEQKFELFDAVDILVTLVDPISNVPFRLVRIGFLFAMESPFSQSTKLTAEDTQIVTYYRIGDYSAGKQGVCVTEVTRTLLDAISFADEPTSLVTFMLGITLFEQDYESTSQFYPLADISAQSEGFSTVFPFSQLDMRLKTEALTGGEELNTKTYQYDTIDTFVASSFAVVKDITARGPLIPTASRETALLIPHYCPEVTLVFNRFEFMPKVAVSTFKQTDTKLSHLKERVVFGVSENRVTEAPMPSGSKDGVDFYAQLYFPELKSAEQSLFTRKEEFIPLNTGNLVNVPGMIVLFKNVNFNDFQVFNIYTNSKMDSTDYSLVSTNKFYFLGQSYKKMRISMFKYKAGTDNLIKDKDFALKSIDRPSLNLLVNQGRYSANEPIMMSTFVKDSFDSLSNLFKLSSNQQVPIYSIDTNKDNWKVNFDTSSSLIYEGYNTNSTVIANVNSSFPFHIGTIVSLKLSAPNLNPFTRCIIDGKFKSPSNCARVKQSDETTFECPIPVDKMSVFPIKCFNVTPGSAVFFEIGKNLVTVEDTLPLNKILFLSPLADSLEVSNITPIDPNPPSLLVSEYLHSQEVNTLAILKLTVDMFVPFFPGDFFILETDFSKLGYPTKCRATFGSDFKTKEMNSQEKTIRGCEIKEGKAIIPFSETVAEFSSDLPSKISIFFYHVVVRELPSPFYIYAKSIPSLEDMRISGYRIKMNEIQHTKLEKIPQERQCSLETIFPNFSGVFNTFKFLIDQRLSRTGYHDSVHFLIPSLTDLLEEGEYPCEASFNIQTKCRVNAYGAIEARFGDLFQLDSRLYWLEIRGLELPQINTDFEMECLFYTQTSLTSYSKGEYSKKQPETETRLAVFEESTIKRQKMREWTDFEFKILVDERDNKLDWLDLGTKTIFLIEFSKKTEMWKLIEEEVVVRIESNGVFVFENTVKPKGFQLLCEANFRKYLVFENLVLSDQQLSFDFKIRGLSISPEETDNVGPIQVSIFNREKTNLIRTTANTHNFKGNLLAEDSFKTNYSGFAILPNDEKILLDVIDTKTAEKNILTVEAGFYSTFKFQVRSYTKFRLSDAATTIEFEEEFIKLKYEGLVVSKLFFSLSEGESYFELGVPCATQTGRYSLRLKSSSTAFTDFPVLTLLVEEGSATLNCPSSITAFKGYYSLFKCTTTKELVDPAVPALREAGMTVNTAIELDKRIEDEFFFRFTADASEKRDKISFTGSSFSKCFFFSNGVEANLTSITINSPSQGDIAEQFVFSTTESDSSLSYDQIKFSVVPQRDKYLMSCALHCGDPPSTEVIAKRIEGNYKLFFTFFDSTEKANFTVKRLKRGLNYKMRCILKTTELKTLHRMIHFDFTTIRFGSDQGNKRAIALIPPQPTFCLELTLTFFLNKAKLKEIRNLSQSFFTNTASKNKDCIFVSDITKSVVPEGKNTISPFCSEPPTITTKNVETNLNFTLCLSQDAKCPNKATEFESQKNDLLNFLNSEESAKETGMEGLVAVQTEDGQISKENWFEDLKVSDFTLDYFGKISFLVHPTDYFRCYFKVIKFSEKFSSSDDISHCTETYCGSFYTSKDKSQVIQQNQSIRKFYREQTFFLLLQCGKKIYPSAYPLSPLEKVSEFKVEALTKNCPLPYLDIDPLNNTDCRCINKDNHIILQLLEGKYCYDYGNSTFLTFGFSLIIVLLY